MIGDANNYSKFQVNCLYVRFELLSEHFSIRSLVTFYSGNISKMVEEVTAKNLLIFLHSPRPGRTGLNHIVKTGILRGTPFDLIFLSHDFLLQKLTVNFTNFVQCWDAWKYG